MYPDGISCPFCTSSNTLSGGDGWICAATAKPYSNIMTTTTDKPDVQVQSYNIS